MGDLIWQAVSLRAKKVLDLRMYNHGPSQAAVDKTTMNTSYRRAELSLANICIVSYVCELKSAHQAMEGKARVLELHARIKCAPFLRAKKQACLGLPGEQAQWRTEAKGWRRG
eukprot:125208-Hanusia_phi.AAC.2